VPLCRRQFVAEEVGHAAYDTHRIGDEPAVVHVVERSSPMRATRRHRLFDADP